MDAHHVYCTSVLSDTSIYVECEHCSNYYYQCYTHLSNNVKTQIFRIRVNLYGTMYIFDCSGYFFFFLFFVYAVFVY